MLKKTVSLLLVLVMLFSLTACHLFGSEVDNPSDDDPKDTVDTDCIYSPTASVVVIKSEKDYVSDLNALTSKIHRLSGKFAVVEMDSSSKKEREIVVGDTKRDISSKAKEMLEAEMAVIRAEYESEGKYDKLLGGFAIYAEGRSVALVWTDDGRAQMAVDYFVENYITGDTLTLSDGHFEMFSHDESDDIIKMQKENQAVAWDKAKEMYSSDTIAALEAHLDLFDERFYLWLADLYEPEATDLEGNVIGGGFYYSNSARDNESYEGVTLLPDLESTSQVLSFLGNSGMINGLSYSKVLPDEMIEQMINFARALQSPDDGYFYHPQWGTNISTSRRSRDCGWGATILSRLGVKPYWDTPSGTSGLYGAPGASASAVSLVMPLSYSMEYASLRAVAASDVWTGAEHLSTLAKWEAYLNNATRTIQYNSYGIGNTLSSQVAQIKNRDKLAVKTGECSDSNGDGVADGGYIETIERIMNNLQFENGLWEQTVSYNSVNGLMKIAGIYSNLGLAMNKADKALLAAVYMVTADVEPDGITDVYNPWVSINALLNNINNHGSAEQSAELRASIKENAESMIRATTERVSQFAKEDGSFSYDQEYSPYKSQSAIVAVRYTNEGDVNGGTIAYTGVWRNMCDVLEIDILPLTFEDYVKFIERVEY